MNKYAGVLLLIIFSMQSIAIGFSPVRSVSFYRPPTYKFSSYHITRNYTAPANRFMRPPTTLSKQSYKQVKVVAYPAP